MLWRIVRVLLVVSVVAGLAGRAVHSQSQVSQINAPVGGAITYQGWLQQNGVAVEGACDLRFALFDAALNGAQVSSTLERPNHPVTGGYFTVGDLDFGVVFTGQARWIEVAVRCPSGSCEFTTLDPRQALTPAPYALHAVNNWSLLGNATTNPTVNFIGTTDAVSLTLKVSDTVALRIEPNAGTPNIIGGLALNRVRNDVVGATISGGGEILQNATLANKINGHFGVIGGGSGNQVGEDAGVLTEQIYATVGGGASNVAFKTGATVSGGIANQATGRNAAVGGGSFNVATGDAATVVGGSQNKALANSATVGGGDSNQAQGNDSTVSGGRQNIAGSSFTTVGGGVNNQAIGMDSTVGGGFGNNATGSYATVAGGQSNVASGDNATVSGGIGAHASHYAEWAYSAGSFDGSQAGVAQTSIYVLHAETTDTNVMTLRLGDSSEDLTIAPGRTVAFDVQIVGLSTGGESAGYTARGVIENQGGTTAFVGLVPLATLGEDDSIWTIAVLAEDSNDSLRITVKGNTGDTVRWVATVRTTEVQN